MPTIAEVAQQLATDGLPVLFIDTCILLDVIRAPIRKIPGCVQSAVELLEMQRNSQCRLVASSMIQAEWTAHENAVLAEFDTYLGLRDLDAFAFHDACELLKIPLAFSKPSYKDTGLGAKLRDLSAELLKTSLHLLPSDESKARATNRTLACIRPAQKGGGLQDCIIIEEYLELCRMLKTAGFAGRRTFCTSNSGDYQDGHKLHEALVAEFEPAELCFTNTLRWAVSELKRPIGSK